MAENLELNPNKQIEKLIENNLEYTKEIYRLQKKVNSYILWGRIMSFIYLIMILAPIILGVIYLPEILNSTINKFMPGGLQESSNLDEILGGSGLNLGDLLKSNNEGKG